VQERLRVAKELFDESQLAGPSHTDHRMPWIILQGAGHMVGVGCGLDGLEREVLDHRKGKPSFLGTAGAEAKANADFLASLGVPTRCLCPESLSYNTLGNAYHARARFVEPYKLRRAVVVTNRFHMPRAKRIFEAIFRIPQEVSGRGRKFNIAVSFHAVPDLGIPPSSMRARMEYEKTAQEWFERMSSTFTCMDSVNTFLKAGQPNTGLLIPDDDSEGALSQRGPDRPSALLLADDGVPVPLD